MNNKIYIFIGSKKDFESFLDEKITEVEEIAYFMELNAHRRASPAWRCI